jgi:acyl-CoA synthetase (AMP-forming)/AMP-acid ligase II
MTELFRPMSHTYDATHDEPGLVGRPVPGVYVKVVYDAGQDRPTGEMGELLIWWPAASDGYVHAPEDTTAAEALADGPGVYAGRWTRRAGGRCEGAARRLVVAWRSGKRRPHQRVRIGSRARCRWPTRGSRPPAIQGRERERILRGGYSVFASDVEDILLGHPEVVEAVVMGQPHEDLVEYSRDRLQSQLQATAAL